MQHKLWCLLLDVSQRNTKTTWSYKAVLVNQLVIQNGREKCFLENLILKNSTVGIRLLLNKTKQYFPALFFSPSHWQNTTERRNLSFACNPRASCFHQSPSLESTRSVIFKTTEVSKMLYHSEKIVIENLSWRKFSLKKIWICNG